MAKGKLVNAKQVYSTGRKDGFFYVTSSLGPARSENGEPPYQTFSGWSRFSFYAVLKGKTSAQANVKPTDVADMKARTAYAYAKHLEAESKAHLVAAEVASGAKSPAYVVKLSSGKDMKGKTPAEVLLGSPNGRADLLRQREWLERNMDRYARYNAPQIQAIDDAIALHDSGALSLEKASSSSAPAIVIFESDLQPQMAKRESDGLCPTYKIRIVFVPGDEYPVTVEITNFRAPVVRTEDGRLNVRAKEKRDEKTLTRTLTGAEWNACLGEIERNMREFEIVNAAALFEDARAADERMKRESGYAGGRYGREPWKDGDAAGRDGGYAADGGNGWPQAGQDVWQGGQAYDAGGGWPQAAQGPWQDGYGGYVGHGG